MTSTAKKLLNVMSGNAEAIPPVWLMRQAGRYLPEYKETRKQAGSFLDLCYNPELAEEVTLQPIRRYGFDAAILFADILLIPQAMGVDLWFVEGEGPRLKPISGREGMGVLKPLDEIDQTLNPIYETVSRLSKSLPAETTLIGFAGAPWTVATYIVAGRGTPDQGPARRWLHSDPAGFDLLIDQITNATIHYLSRQIEAGAEVVKIFDSWAGTLPFAAFQRYSVEPAKKITEALKSKHPGIPIIGFPRGGGMNYETFARQTGVNCIATDAGADMALLSDQLDRKVAVQGNMDPMLMVLGGQALESEAKRIVGMMEARPYVFNLGHGITPDADPANVDLLLRAIRG